MHRIITNKMKNRKILHCRHNFKIQSKNKKYYTAGKILKSNRKKKLLHCPHNFKMKSKKKYYTVGTISKLNWQKKKSKTRHR